METKKSQSALEFLMTYGWAFLMMLIVISAIAYFGVLRPQKLLPDRCTFNLAFDCQGFRIGSGASGTFNLRLSNNVGATITVTAIDLSVPTGTFTCTTAPALPITNWRTGDVKDLAWSNCNTDAVGLVAGEKGKILVKITYYDIAAGSAYSQIAEGEVLSAVS